MSYLECMDHVIHNIPVNTVSGQVVGVGGGAKWESMAFINPIMSHYGIHFDTSLGVGFKQSMKQVLASCSIIIIYIAMCKQSISTIPCTFS